MMSMIGALSFGNYWKLHDPDSINTSFPSFINLIKNDPKKTLINQFYQQK